MKISYVLIVLYNSTWMFNFFSIFLSFVFLIFFFWCWTHVVIHLIYFEDLSYDEAGKVMKKSRKQVDNLLYRAKKELRIILGKDGELLL